MNQIIMTTHSWSEKCPIKVSCQGLGRLYAKRTIRSLSQRVGVGRSKDLIDLTWAKSVWLEQVRASLKWQGLCVAPGQQWGGQWSEEGQTTHQRQGVGRLRLNAVGQQRLSCLVQGVTLASKFPRSQSVWASVGCAETTSLIQWNSTLQHTGREGSAANVLAPDTTSTVLAGPTAY